MYRRSFLAAGSVAALMPAAARAATPVAFDGSWQALTFRRIPATAYRLGGATLGIVADRSSSVIWRRAPVSAAGRASWDWAVAASVPPTDLSRKGGDDRNAALYFVFADARTAEGIGESTSLTRLLSRRGVRALIYVWGGAAGRGAMIPSPYMRGRGVSVIRRPAGTGSHSEAVDLAGDHAAAFGAPPEVLVGLAVSADGDDTDTRVEASLSGLMLS